MQGTAGQQTGTDERWWTKKENSAYEFDVTLKQTGKIPREWKRADGTPLFRSANGQEPLNYKPVSLPSIMCQLCDNHKKIMDGIHGKEEDTDLERDCIQKWEIISNKATGPLLTNSGYDSRGRWVG